MAWNTQTSYSSSYHPTNADFQGFGNDLRTHGGDVNVNGFKMSNIGSWTSTLQPRAYASAGVATSVPTATWTALALSVDVITPIGISRSSGAFTVPTTGLYFLSGAIGFAGSAAGTTRYAEWYKNGASLQIVAGSAPVGSAAIYQPAPAALVALAAGDVITLQAYQDSGGALLTIVGFTYVSIFQLA
jgi:hypothetical protein